MLEDAGCEMLDGGMLDAGNWTQEAGRWTQVVGRWMLNATQKILITKNVQRLCTINHL